MRIAPVWIKDKWRSTLDWLTSPPGGPRPGRPLEAPPEPKRPDQPPRSGPRPGGGRRPVSEEPKPGSIDDVGKKLEALQALEQALEAERAAQAKRLAALSECESVARAPVGPVPAEKLQGDLDALKQALDNMKEEFEKLQQELKKEVGDQLGKIEDLNAAYNQKWAEAMKSLEAYLQEYPNIMVDLQNIWDEFGNREWARKVAEWVDTTIQAVQAGRGAYHLGAGVVKGLAAEGKQAAQVLGTTATKGEAAAIRAASASGKGAPGATGPAATAGLGKTILFGDEVKMIELAKQIKPLPGYFDVFIHGERTGLAFQSGGQWIDMTADQVIRAMRANGYTGGPVRLVACSSGGGTVGEGAARTFAPGVAKELSAKLGTKVIAPSDKAWLWPNGNITVGSNPYIRNGHWTGYGFSK